VLQYLSGSFKQRMREEACCEKMGKFQAKDDWRKHVVRMGKFSPPSTCDTPSGKALPDEYLKGVSVQTFHCLLLQNEQILFKS
jgi:hypothetical protein